MVAEKDGAASAKDEILRLLAKMAGDPEQRPVVQRPEVLDDIIQPGSLFVSLTRDSLNMLLRCLSFVTVTEGFFQHFWPQGINSVHDLETGVTSVLKASMLHFGNFQMGFQTLAKEDRVADFLERLQRVPKIQPRSLAGMVTSIARLTPEQAHALGYATESDLPQTEIQEARTKGRANAEKFLGMDPVEVYVAASMRKVEDFREAQRFIDSVFKHELLAPLRLRFFNPLACDLGDSAQKGLLEGLMFNRAAVMVYLAGRGDSFGKDVELASMLTQGKPVIVYVNRKYRKRGSFLRESHPLRLQIEHSSGVAHGIIVVDHVNLCVGILRDLFMHTLETEIEEHQFNYFLFEKKTRSQIRVVTKNRYLSGVFWDSFCPVASVR